MKLNQKGFSAVEILIVIVVITLVGFVGWRVYDSNESTNETGETTTQEAESTSGVEAEESTKTEDVTTPTDEFEGWEDYSMKKSDISFRYPADWNIETTLDSSERTFEEIILTAPDKSEIRLTLFKFLGGFSGDEPSVVIDDVVEATNEATNKTFSALTHKSEGVYTSTSIGVSEKGEFTAGDSRQLFPRWLTVELGDGTKVQFSVTVSGEGDEDFGQSKTYSSLDEYKQIDAYKNTKMFMRGLNVSQ